MKLAMAVWGTWVEEPSLQSGPEGHEQLLPLVSPLQAVLEVLDGRPGIWEICKGTSLRERSVCEHVHKGAGAGEGLPSV